MLGCPEKLCENAQGRTGRFPLKGSPVSWPGSESGHESMGVPLNRDICLLWRDRGVGGNSTIESALLTIGELRGKRLTSPF